MERCKNCRFYKDGRERTQTRKGKQIKVKPDGVCRKSPPRVDETFPRIKPGEWCGAWEEKVVVP